MIRKLLNIFLNQSLIKNNLIYNRFILLLAIILLSSSFTNAKLCQIDSIYWSGDYSEFDKSQMDNVKGKSCDNWVLFADKLTRYYEDMGFIGAQVIGNIYDNVLSLKINRGSAYVFAAPENLDSSRTKIDVFRKLSGIEEGSFFSLSNLERSEQKLLRLGYFEKTGNTKIYRDSVRNRIIPVFSMRKASVSNAEGILTYSSDENSLEGQIDVNLYNIAGTARDLFLEGFSGDNYRHLKLSYKEPWIFGTFWNLVIRGSFDEEVYEYENLFEDSNVKKESEKIILGEIGITRDVGYHFLVGVFLGITENDKHSSFEISYVSLDRFILPRKGSQIEGRVIWKMARKDSLDNILKVFFRTEMYYPIIGNLISRYTGIVGAIFPLDIKLDKMDLFYLGGPDDFKGMQYHMVRSRSYGVSELSILWQDNYDLSFELFYEPGIFRRMIPKHGWESVHNYGIGFVQYREKWSISLYYALRNGCDYLDGILGFGVKTLF